MTPRTITKPKTLCWPVVISFAEWRKGKRPKNSPNSLIQRRVPMSPDSQPGPLGIKQKRWIERYLLQFWSRIPLVKISR